VSPRRKRPRERAPGPKPRAREPEPAARKPEPAARKPEPAARKPEPAARELGPVASSGGRGLGRPALLDLLSMLGAFAIVSAIAGIAGAPNLGTALSFGQIGFGLAAVYVLLRR
jgi:hypothetical protein